MSPIIWVLLGAVALIFVSAVLVLLHGRGLGRANERHRAEMREFVESKRFRWDDQKKR